MGKLRIIKWNIYLANMPFIDNPKLSKNRPIIVLNYWAQNVTVLPLTTNLEQTKYDVEIIINNKKSLVKIPSLQTINIKKIIKPFLEFNDRYAYVNYEKQKEIAQQLLEYTINNPEITVEHKKRTRISSLQQTLSKYK